MAESCTLVAIAGGESYVTYAEQLMESARKYFFPTPTVDYLILEGEEGWPNGTMYRWHRLLENMPETDYVFMCDADMRLESWIREEILSDAITVTQHPGYVGIPPSYLPFERRVDSCCSVHYGDRYFAGGFAGGPRKEVKRFANDIVRLIDSDMSQGIVPLWHDESALNKVCTYWRDLHILDPSYCYPDNDTHYVESVWKSPYKRRLVALDKTREERGNR